MSRDCDLCADSGGTCPYHRSRATNYERIEKLLRKIVDPDGYGLAIPSDLRRDTLSLLAEVFNK